MNPVLCLLNKKLMDESFILFPVRCVTCGKVVGQYQNEYEELISKGKYHSEAIDEIVEAHNLSRYCCRKNLFLLPQFSFPGDESSNPALKLVRTYRTSQISVPPENIIEDIGQESPEEFEPIPPITSEMKGSENEDLEQEFSFSPESFSLALEDNIEENPSLDPGSELPVSLQRMNLEDPTSEGNEVVSSYSLPPISI
jgi:DNA-directed RNA polymerase subunit N